MNEQVNEISQWIIKGDHDLGTAKITYLYKLSGNLLC
jgi:hypothetical protein